MCLEQELQMENIGEDVDGNQEQGRVSPTEENGNSAILDTDDHTSTRSLQPLVAPVSSLMFWLRVNRKPFHGVCLIAFPPDKV